MSKIKSLRQSPKRKTNGTNKSFPIDTNFLLGIFAIIIIVVVFFFSLRACNTTDRATGADSEMSNPLNYTDDFYIVKDCAATYTKEDFETMIDYVNRGNKSSFEDMVLNGRIVYLYKGDNVKIEEMGFGWAKVKTEKGQFVYVVKEILSDKVYDSNGDMKYHHQETGDKQKRYGGSAEQQQDLEMIDEYAKTHPDF
ncbi:hypothetical protein AAE250_12130 [Bacteroides sp. GD17]|uniref:hypothetical protein n=1 Tax=Bacteroides sp. GD17 TaxID=3139826 RepID=UPI00313C481B